MLFFHLFVVVFSVCSVPSELYSYLRVREAIQSVKIYLTLAIPKDNLYQSEAERWMPDCVDLCVHSNISMRHALTQSSDSIAKSLDSIGSLGEYGDPDPDPAKFTEDGSFIGQYSF